MLKITLTFADDLCVGDLQYLVQDRILQLKEELKSDIWSKRAREALTAELAQMQNIDDELENGRQEGEK